MANVLDYLTWRGDLPPERVPLCDVDALVFARLSYVPFDGIVPGDFASAKPLRQAAEQALAKAEAGGITLRTEDGPLLRALLDAPRYHGISLCGYESVLDIERQEQFAALTLLLPQGICVAYRGTDGTLVGWKEDFNMAFSDSVPAQRHAVEYLRQAAAIPGDIRLCGHSKGGNLAVYAAAFCGADIQERIVSVRNFDGPGFQQSVTEREEFQRIMPRTRTYLPRSSVIGMMLEHEEAYTVVESGGVGISQHNVYLWEIVRGGFQELAQVSSGSQLVDHTLKNWLAGMDQAQREKVVNGLYAAMQASQAETVRDVREHGKMATLRAILEQDEETRRLTLSAIRVLYWSLKRALPDSPLKGLEERLPIFRDGKQDKES